MTAFKGIVFLLMMVFSSNIYAQLKSEFYFKIDPNIYSKWILKSVGSQNVKLNISHFEILEPLKTDVYDLSLNLKQSLEIFAIENDPSLYRYKIDLQDLKVNMRQIVTDHVIHRSESGVDLSIRIQGECLGLEAVLDRGEVQLEGAVRLNFETGKLKLSSENSKIHLRNLEWTLDSGACRGPQNYEEKLSQAILDKLKDQEFLKSMIKDSLDVEFQKLSNKVNESVFAQKIWNFGKRLNLTMIPGALSINNTGHILLKGNLWLQSSENPYKKQIHFDADINDETKNDIQNGLILPRQILSESSQFIYHSRLLNENYYTKDIDGLQSLMKSRFAQFFVWPDLRKFPKRTNFLLRSYPRQSPTWKNLATLDGDLSADMKIRGDVLMSYPNQGKWSPYINFYTKLNSLLEIKLRSSKLNISFKTPKLQFYDQWNGDYVRARKPNQRIARRFLRDTIADKIAETKLQYDLPALDFSGTKLAPNSFELKRNVLLVPFVLPENLRQEAPKAEADYVWDDEDEDDW